jgi:hypothetical protein
MELLAQNGGGTIARACRSDAAGLQGGYRLLRNSQLSVHAMREAGFAGTLQPLQAGRRTLAIEDTSVLSYSHALAGELGDTGGPKAESSRGLWAHTTLLVDAQSGATHGLIAQTLWCRAQERGKKHQRRQKRYEEKESFKWSLHAQQMRDRLGDRMGDVITVSDRESDVFAYLQDKHEHRERFIVRAAQDRALEDSEGRLSERLSNGVSRGELQIEVPQRGGRAARTACLSLKAEPVSLRAPVCEGIDSRPCLPVNVILAQEDSGEPAQRLCWILLTSEPIQTQAQVQDLLRCYAMRWRIEEFHKAWKSGAQVEELRLQDKVHLERMVTMLAFVAVRLLQLRETLDNKQAAESPCTTVLSATEWKVLWASSPGNPPALPKQPPTLRWAYEAVAKLGGFYDSKRTGRASWAAMYEGWKQLQAYVDVLSKLGKSP